MSKQLLHLSQGGDGSDDTWNRIKSYFYISLDGTNLKNVLPTDFPSEDDCTRDKTNILLKIDNNLPI